MSYTQELLIDRQALNRLRGEVGAELPRLAGYFREDAVKSIVLIEEALRNKDATALVRPAHTLKGEAWQFGAMRLGSLAEEIEKAARRAVEERDFPEILEEVVQLRPLFEETSTLLAEEVAPKPAAAAATSRPMGFGRKVAPGAFGRA